MDTRIWTAPGGSNWAVTIDEPSDGMAIPLDFDLDKLPPIQGKPQMYFTDLADSTKRQCVQYTMDKPLSELSNDEIKDYWMQLVEKYPEFS
jgi:hypothetical protein